MIRDHVLRAVDERVALNAVRAVYPHLRFLDDLASAPHGDLADYFPETAAGALRPRRGESLYPAGGVDFVGRDDGTMVPVDAQHLEPMPENIWDAGKFATLVEAAESGREPAVDPGYADLTLEGDALVAQVRDGNHRTFAPVAAGADYSWVMVSDRTRQEIDERAPGSDALYRAIRAAQRRAVAPLLKRRPVGRVAPGKREELIAAERRYRDLEVEVAEVERTLLREYGPAQRAGGGSRDLAEQLRRPGVYWRQRFNELDLDMQDEVLDGLLGRRFRDVDAERHALGMKLYDMRREAGLKHGERLDPDTGEVVR